MSLDLVWDCFLGSLSMCHSGFGHDLVFHYGGLHYNINWDNSSKTILSQHYCYNSSSNVNLSLCSLLSLVHRRTVQGHLSLFLFWDNSGLKWSLPPETAPIAHRCLHPALGHFLSDHNYTVPSYKSVFSGNSGGGLKVKKSKPKIAACSLKYKHGKVHKG